MQIVKQGVTLTVVTAAGFVVWEASHNPPRVQVPHDMPSAYAPDAEVGYVLKPNLSFRSSANSTIEYYTNERGIRSSGPGEKAPIQADILVIGCSQTFGQSVLSEATFAAVIGQELGLRAINLSVSGYGGINSLLLAWRFMDLQPSILVYGLGKTIFIATWPNASTRTRPSVSVSRLFPVRRGRRVGSYRQRTMQDRCI